MQERGEIGGEHARLRGDGSKPRADKRKADDEAQERKPEGPFRDVSRAGGARVARAERCVRERRQERGDQRHDESEPHRVADKARGLADQPVDAGAEHAAEPVQGKLHRPDRAPERRLLARFG